MASYAIDVRQPILHAYERRLGSPRALADLFGVSRSCVEKRLRRQRTTGDIAPKPPGGGPRPCGDAAAQAQVRQLRHHQSEATVEALGPRTADLTGLRVSVPTMCRLVPR